MTAIAAARKASTAARTTAVETQGAQAQLDLAQLSIKSYDTQAKGLRAVLNAELQKSPPNAVQVQNLRNGIATLEGLRDGEKAKLPALRQAVSSSMTKQGEASAAALKEEQKILAAKAALEKDQFSAKSSAGGKRLGGAALEAGAGMLDSIEKSLKAKLKDPNLTRAEKREIKEAISKLQHGEAVMERTARKLESSARGDDAKVRSLDRKLQRLEPAATEAQALLNQDVTDLVKLSLGTVSTNVKAAVTEADEKANGAGTIAQVDAVLGSKNSDRAMNAWQRVDAVANGSAEAKARLTPEVRDMLVQGVAQSRTNDSLGQEGILSQRQAEQAAKALATMPKDRYDTVMKLLAAAGGTTGDAQTERALILKAVAVRGDKLTNTTANPWAQMSAVSAMGDVLGFATDIRGEQKDKLIRSTSPVDLNGSVNDSLIRPEDLRGVQNATDPYSNNDGRFQKFGTTCAPTTSQIVKEEADPVAARRMSKDLVADADPTTAAAQQQRAVLGSSGGSTSSRRAEQAHGRAMEIARGLKFSKLELAVLDNELRGSPLKAFDFDFGAAGLLKRVQAADGGMPGATELGWMKKELSRDNDGMSTVDALNNVAARTVGYDYKQVAVGGSVTAAWTDSAGKAQSTTMSVPSAADFATWDAKLKEGDDVPLRITGSSGNGGHAITITDVRDQPDRQYLISDPWSGSSSWIKQSEISAGLDANGRSWMTSHYGLGWDRISHFHVEK